MPVGAGLRPAAEGLVDQVGKPRRDGEERGVAGRACLGDRGLYQVAGAVELVTLLQVAPAPRGVDDLAPAVQVAVRLLRGGDELDGVGIQPRELVRRLAPELPAEGLEPLVDVRVAEDHAAPFAGRTAGGDAQVVERAGTLELLRTPQDRDLPVRPLALPKQATLQLDAPRIDRAQRDAGSRRRHDSPHDRVAHQPPPCVEAFVSKRFAKRFDRTNAGSPWSSQTQEAATA